jgi:protocatechuate 3,4-dioxygenase alpha subunit
MTTTITPSQTIGPFPHEAWRWAFAGAVSEPLLTIFGTVFDGEGQPVPDALIEAWLPGDPAAAVPGLPGLYRVPSDAYGGYRLALPRRPLPGEPACYVVLFARGMLRHHFCAVFLADDPRLDVSPVLTQVPGERRATLLAKAEGEGASYRWDVHLQGAKETAFLDFC